MTKHWTFVAVVLALAVAGCSGSGSNAIPGGDGDDAAVEQFGTTTPGPSDPGTTDTTDTTKPADDDDDDGGGGTTTACGGDAPGIINSWCDGPASVTFTVDGEGGGTLAGGECVIGTDDLLFVAGTSTDPDIYEGPLLDYAAIQAPAAAGEFDDGVITIVLDEEPIILVMATGSHDRSSGTFEGEDDEGHSIEGTFDC